MKIKQVSTDALIPYALNNRRHSEKQTDRIAASITEFGFNQPIVVDNNNVVIVGHGRLEAAKKLGLKEVPAVEVGELTDAQIKAYRILDNKLQNDSEWDIDNLQLEFGVLNDLDFDLSFGGLDELSSLFDKEEPEVAEDDFEPEEIDEPFIKQGDLIELGRHRVLCGDSTNGGDVAYLMDGAMADLWLTDPPYNVAYTGKTADALTIDNDSMSDGEFRDFLGKCFDLAFESLKAGAAYYIWHDDSGGYNFRGAVFDCGEEVRQCLIWLKNTMVMGRQDYQWKHEACLYGWKSGASHHWYSDRKQTTILEFDRPSRSAEHPTMKPIKLFSYQIVNSSKSGDIVLDTFLGSGTTLVAAEQLGRTCYGMELSPKYCQVILERYKKYCEDNNKAFECKINGEEYKA
jgi:DNA modification methylase